MATAADFLPYWIAERRFRAEEGTGDYLRWIGRGRIKKSFRYWLPYCIVTKMMLAKERRRKLGERAPRLASGPLPGGMDAVSRRTVVERVRAARNDSGAGHPEARILVCLHVFYPDLWPVVRAYLENLAPYRWDLSVTYPEGMIDADTLADIRRFRPDARLTACRNAGFDIGPFVESLRGVGLSAYDVVFKLHTKGCGRDSIYIYDQVFKRSDWFLNLYEAVLGGDRVHAAVGMIMEGAADLVAAENLLVRDPKHKRYFVKRFCEERGLGYREDYRFVAGTCFAACAAVFRPLQTMGLTLADFADTVRGEFSLAHAVERTMCFPAVGRMAGIPVPHEEYDNERGRLLARSAYRMLEDPRFELDAEFFYKCMEFMPVSRWEVVKVRLGDIRRVWYDNRAYPLSRCSPFRYLRGDRDAYKSYCAVNAELSGYAMSEERYDRLRESMSVFNPRFMPIVFGKSNIIVDGQHRACILLDRLGADGEIDVVRIFD